MLLSATGMMLLVAANELITIYIALELITLPLAALAAFMPNGRSSEAGMKFLIVGAISSALMLYGMALIYGFTGSTRLDEIAVALASAATSGVIPFGSLAVLLAVVLLLVGFGFKMSAAPFQMWVPDVYEGAPTPIVAFLSVASKAAAFALVMRVFYIGFDSLAGDWWVLLANSGSVVNDNRQSGCHLPTQHQPVVWIQYHRPRRLPSGRCRCGSHLRRSGKFRPQ